jgi:hypothetical protein
LIAEASAAERSRREDTPSFRNTFPRWYSTVFELMNSCAAISRLVMRSAASLAIWASSRPGSAGGSPLVAL